MKVKYEPTRDKKVSGWVEVEFYDFETRWAKTEEMLAIANDEAMPAQKRELMLAKFLLLCARERSRGVQLTRGAVEYGTFDDVLSDPRLTPTAREIGELVVLGEGGSKKGNDEEPSSTPK